MKYSFTLSIGLQGGREEEVEIDDSEIEGMSQEEIDEYAYEQWKEWIWNYIDGGVSKA